jgi:hypothetical protein
MNTREIMDLALQMAGLDEIPYDSGVIVPGDNIRSVLMGVDMATPELLLAKELGVDLVISHHPQGGEPSIHFHKVMERQIECMVKAGVPVNKAQKALKPRRERIERDSHVSNYDRTGSAARLLNMPFMNIHMPLDIISENTVQAYLDQRVTDPRATLKDVIDALMEMGEYRNALACPCIRVGAEKDYAGRVLVLMAGGTNGGEQVFKAYFEAGVGTIVCMHVPEEVRKAVQDQNIGNIIVAGHMASDSIGINRFLDALRNNGLAVQTMSGITSGIVEEGP